MDRKQLQRFIRSAWAVRRLFGFALSLAQAGDKHDSAKVLKGFHARLKIAEAFITELRK